MFKKLIILLFVLLGLASFLFKNISMGFNSLFSAFLIFLLFFANKKFCIFSSKENLCISLFIVLSVFLGRGVNLYRLVPFWDKILHFYSGLISYPVGICIFKKLDGKTENIKLKTSFALLFSLSLALLWEVWEFSGDRIFGLNSQNNSLSDTMSDMILASLGSSIYMLACIFKNSNTPDNL